jgi:hypothetical protein
VAGAGFARRRHLWSEGRRNVGPAAGGACTPVATVDGQLSWHLQLSGPVVALHALQVRLGGGDGQGPKTHHRAPEGRTFCAGKQRGEDHSSILPSPVKSAWPLGAAVALRLDQEAPVRYRLNCPRRGRR